MENIVISMEDRLNLAQIDMLEEIMKKCVNCIFNEYKGAKVPMFESDAFNVNYFE